MFFGAFIIGVFNIFCYCFFGKSTTENFDRIANCLFQSNWIELPVKLQKYFVIIIGNAHKPFFYHGLGIVVLDLESFAKVSEENV